MDNPNDFGRLHRQLAAELQAASGERLGTKKSLPELIQEVTRLTHAAPAAPSPTGEATGDEDHSIERAAAHLRLPLIAPSNITGGVSAEAEVANVPGKWVEADRQAVERKPWRRPLRWAAFSACMLMMVTALGTGLSLVQGEVDTISVSAPPVRSAPEPSEPGDEIAMPIARGQNRPETTPEPEVAAKAVPAAEEPPREIENPIAQPAPEPAATGPGSRATTPAVAAGVASTVTGSRHSAKRLTNRRHRGAQVQRRAVRDH